MNKEAKIHVFYIFVILIAVIICLIAFQWHDIPKLVELITFALTVTSLVLAILAIAYAVYSNSSFTHNITTLNAAAQDVSDAAVELKGKIETIPTRLDSMEGRFDELKLLFQSTEFQDVRTPSKEEKAATSEISDLFINRLPISSLIVLYAFFRAFKKKKPINFKELFSNLNTFSNSNYAVGLYVGMYGTGLLGQVREAEQVSTITSFNEKLMEQMETDFNNIVDQAFEKFTERYGSESAARVRVNYDSDIESINQLF